jgi:hypothetical protein
MFIPEDDRIYLDGKGYQFEEIIDNGKKGLLIKNWQLPESKYTQVTINLLIIIPDGYSDIPPDMFYTYPIIYLLPNRNLAEATGGALNFNNITWQQWSRHAITQDWRPGIDGIHTYLKKVQNALNTAK